MITKEQFDMYKDIRGGGLGNGCGPTLVCGIVVLAIIIMLL